MTLDLSLSNFAGGGTVPFSVPLAPGQDIRLESVTALWNGSGASDSFKACLSLYSQDGVLLSRTFPSQVFAIGDSGEVTYAPPLGDSIAASGGGAVIALIDFNPVGNQVQVTSNNPAAPTLVIDAGSIVFDGITTVRIDFYAAGMDIDQRGIANTGALLLELYDGTTALGIISDFNATNQAYAAIPCFVSAVITPTAGTHDYKIMGYRQGGGGGAVGPTFVYGANLTTAHVTRPGYMSLTAI